MTITDEAPPEQGDESHLDSKPRERRSKFRFKSESRRHRSHRPTESNLPYSSTTHHHHHHHRRRKPQSSPHSSTSKDVPLDPFLNPAYGSLDPDAAFRESLFDAMADDEGAAYWETVYGQPIHVFAPPASSTTAPGDVDGTAQMTDDEYAAYVRQKMWEKTHAGLLEERAARQRRREEADSQAEENRRATREMERNAKKSEERRKIKVWRDRWEAYLDGWKAWEGDVEKLPWPTESGRREEEISKLGVRVFFAQCLEVQELGERQFATRLKDERIRWHPDKLQQKLGGNSEEAFMRDVTAVFQIIDQLWSEVRKR